MIDWNQITGNQILLPKAYMYAIGPGGFELKFRDSVVFPFKKDEFVSIKINDIVVFEGYIHFIKKSSFYLKPYFVLSDNLYAKTKNQENSNSIL